MKNHYKKNLNAEKMVRHQIIDRGILDSRLIEIMNTIPRDYFVLNKKNMAYDDKPLTIGHKQTISQPYMVALMTEKLELKGHEKVLEIGTGSGYQTAVLAEMAKKVYTVERIPALYEEAKKRLIKLGYMNINFKLGDGSVGWEEESPFDAIIVTAAMPKIPASMKDQIADNGIMVVPVGDYAMYQLLMIVKRIGNRFNVYENTGCRFVPIIGKEGF